MYQSRPLNPVEDGVFEIKPDEEYYRIPTKFTEFKPDRRTISELLHLYGFAIYHNLPFGKQVEWGGTENGWCAQVVASSESMRRSARRCDV